jgi:cupin 2 domain-containing protein
MPTRRCDRLVDRPDNLFRGIPDDLPQEQIISLVEGQAARVERIVSRGQASPPGFWYDQPLNEWVAVLTGSAGLRFEDEPDTLALGPGDHVLIPAHRRHRVEWTDPTSPTVWLAVHLS